MQDSHDDDRDKKELLDTGKDAVEEAEGNDQAKRGRPNRRLTRHAIRTSGIPVSYTHLDVYKRQDQRT